MTASARDFDDQVARARHHGAWSRSKNTVRQHRAKNVQTICSNRLVATDQVCALFEHHASAIVTFFTRLKPNHNIAVQLVFMCRD